MRPHGAAQAATRRAGRTSVEAHEPHGLDGRRGQRAGRRAHTRAGVESRGRCASGWARAAPMAPHTSISERRASHTADAEVARVGRLGAARGAEAAVRRRPDGEVGRVEEGEWNLNPSSLMPG
jgi:hypothetical protein